LTGGRLADDSNFVTTSTSDKVFLRGSIGGFSEPHDLRDGGERWVGVGMRKWFRISLRILFAVQSLHCTLYVYNVHIGN